MITRISTNIFVLFFSVVFTSHAQIEIDRPEKNYLDRKDIYYGPSEEFYGLISLHGNYEINSNKVTNSFVNKLLFNGFISDDIKDHVSKRLGNKNRVGYEFNVGLTGTAHIKEQDMTVLAGIGYREHMDVKFSKDLFEVAFRGNSQFGGRHADLGNTNLNYFNYQYLFLGLARTFETKPITIGAGISLLRGGQYQSIDVERGHLFTEESGEYIDLNTSFALDFNQPQKSQWNSAGLGASLYLVFQYSGEKGILNAELRDLGFISWRKLNNVAADSSFRYDGVEIENILDYNNYTFSTINADSIREQFGLSKNIRNKTQALPFSFNVNYTYFLSEKVHLMGGVKHLAFANYSPRIYVKSFFNLKERFMLTPGLLYGGYGGLNFELSATKSFEDKLLISGSIMCLEYFLLPKQTQGLGFYLNMVKIF